MKAIQTSLMLFSLLLTTQTWAQWQLAETSDINFTTVKKGMVVESHRFSGLTGSVSATGSAQINIPLVSVDTGIAIRDSRMQEMLFQVAQFPQAVITANVDVNTLLHSQGKAQQVELKLNLHGIEKTYTALLRVNKHSDSVVNISTVKSLVVNAADFGLTAGIERLRDVAGLPSITPSVAVNVNLVFSR